MRWYRRDDLDEFASPEAPVRSDRLRELVDQLPDDARHIIERLFFGQADLLETARELGINAKRARAIRDRALDTLRQQVLEDHEMGSVPSGSDPARALFGSRTVGYQGEDPGPGV